MQAFLWSRVSPEGGARQASQSANAWGARLTCLVRPHMRQHFRLTKCIIPMERLSHVAVVREGFQPELYF